MSLLRRLRRSDEERTGTMTLMEHLTELRRRVIICLLAIGGGAIVGWFLYEPFMELIRGPFCDFVTAHPASRPPAGCNLVFQGPLDAMLVKLKAIFFLGLGVALPVVLFQLWAFIVPGLTGKEKRWSIPFVVSSFVLFLLGGVFAFITLPKALDFLLGFAGESAVPLITIDRYVGFVTLVTLAFGVSFLFPVLLVFLELVGVVSPAWLASQRRYSLLAISIFAAIITPSSDPYSMLGMMVPMYLFYEASIIIGRLLKRERT